MAVTIKSEREIVLMREAGRVLAIAHTEMKKALKPGISTKAIDRIGEEVIRSYGCIPNFKNYHGYPASVCVSINNEVIHGIPSEKRIIQEGDIVSLDCGCIYKGYHSDAARTHGVGEIAPEAKKLIEVTRQSFFEGIKFAKEGYHLVDIARAIQQYNEQHGFSVVRDFVGHGIGRNLHESPDVPNFVSRGKGIRLREGITLAIEPMINMGHYSVAICPDEWTIVTRDGSLSAHYENTVLITNGEPELLTIGDEIEQNNMEI